jgi:hypothetical protein
MYLLIFIHWFFVALSTPYDQHQQPASSNPWNMPSSTFPSTSNNNSGSISPPYSGLTTGGNLLYPTIAGGIHSNSNDPSPLPSASRKTPESFLGENFGNLVNLDKLVTEPKSNKIKTKRLSFSLHISFLL